MGNRGCDRGFTLIELILVMALLSTIMAVAAPNLSRFFRGRALQEETRRFLALTRYARNEAVSRSVMIELWIDPEEGSYGLTPLVEYTEAPKPPLEYILAENLHFDIEEEALDEEGLATMLFWPDGAIDAESLQDVRIVESNDKMIEVTQADFGLGYVAGDVEFYAP